MREAVVVVRVCYVAVGKVRDAAEVVIANDAAGLIGSAGDAVVSIVHSKLDCVTAMLPRNIIDDAELLAASSLGRSRANILKARIARAAIGETCAGTVGE